MKIESVDAPNSFSAMDYFSDAKGTINKQMPGQRFTVEVVEEGDKTRLVSRSTLETNDQLEELIKMGMAEGFSSQLNKLEGMLQNKI